MPVGLDERLVVELHALDFSSEEWKVIPSFPKYEASSCGRMRNRKTGRVLDPFPSGFDGKYDAVRPCVDGGPAKCKMLHRLVCEAFHGPPPFPGAQCDHINRDSVDNRPANLRWVDIKTNHANRGPKTPRRHSDFWEVSASASIC